jgi:probable HAF family extracellular repeat protein
MNRKLVSFALAGIALAAMPAASFAQYKIQTLTYPGSDSMTPTSIAGGLISGNAYTDSGLNAALWTPSGLQMLIGPEGSTVLGVSAVNRFGDAIGTAGGGRSAPRGLVWKGGVAEYLPQEDNDADETEYLYQSRAIGINSKGSIAGNAETEYGDVGVFWDGDQISLLMSLDPIGEYQRSVARAINESDQIVGSADLAGDRKAVVWENGGVRQINGLGELSGAADINDSGMVVGWNLNEDGSTSAFVHDGITTSLLPTLPGLVYGDAAAINNAGIIVGYSAPEGVEEGKATMWRNGQVIDLNSLLGPEDAGWNLISAVDIDEDGTIIGFGRYNGEYAAFVLRPVPEPASMVALALGVGALLRRGRRKSG